MTDTPGPTGPMSDDEIRRELGELFGEIYACTRDWSAWGYGTMTEDDFIPAGDDPDIMADFVEFVRTVATRGVVPAPAETGGKAAKAQ